MFLREIKYRDDKLPNFEEYPFKISILKNKNFKLSFDKKLTFLIGENGSGKSTLLEAIALNVGFNPAGGSRNNVYSSVQTESPLTEYLRLVWNQKTNDGFFMRAETFFNFASHVDQIGSQNAYGGESLHQKSHGEAFLALFLNRFKEGLFIFDEPEAALSPQRQLAFLALLHERLQSDSCQVIIATHSPILLSYPGALIYELNEKGVTKTSYKETEHYKITKDFLNNPEAFHYHLFKE